MTFLAKWLPELPRFGYHPDPAMVELSEGQVQQSGLYFLFPAGLTPLLPCWGVFLRPVTLAVPSRLEGRFWVELEMGRPAPADEYRKAPLESQVSRTQEG